MERYDTIIDYETTATVILHLLSLSDLSRRAGLVSSPTVKEKGKTVVLTGMQKARERCRITIF